ncbi:transposase [Candidatus Latescibacterota bacterium]
MVSLQDILRAGCGAYRAAYRPRAEVVRWALSVMACRTAALGAHVLRCPKGHVHRVAYNSCKHRACPQCGSLTSERWLDRVRSKLLLDCDYYHVIFTVPHELQDLWRWNRAGFGNVLLGTVRDTLLELLVQPQWIGALPGVMLALHTSGRQLGIHPHVHALVTAGGWTAAGWQQPKHANYLVAGQVMRGLFKKKLLARLREGLLRGQLVAPHEGRMAPCLRLLNGLYDKEWCVHIRAKYPHGRGVMIYLARYLRGGPLKRTQLLSLRNGQVTFRHFDHQTGGLKQVTLSPESFIAALAEHVPEPNQVMVRYCGLYAHSHRGRLDQCRGWLGMSAAQEPEYLTAVAYLERLGLVELTRCPVCNRRLEMVKLTEASGLPPPREDQREAA